MSRNITLEKHSKAKRLGSSHSPAPQFWEGPLNSGKVSVPPKNGPFEGVNKFFGPPKKIPPGKWMWHVLFAKKFLKIRQIWPRRSLKHFTAAYRWFPPCTQSQPPINRETGIQQCTRSFKHFEYLYFWLSLSSSVDSGVMLFWNIWLNASKLELLEYQKDSWGW